jgi:hypothetical protein
MNRYLDRLILDSPRRRDSLFSISRDYGIEEYLKMLLARVLSVCDQITQWEELPMALIDWIQA